ncbi:MAG: hypothetical protein VKI63_02500 [Cyanobium sp.]|nr:hypothetical protein [Cyanobium sp.]
MRNPSPLAALAKKPDDLRETLAQALVNAQEKRETPASGLFQREGVPSRMAGDSLGLSPGPGTFGEAVRTPEGRRAAMAFSQNLLNGDPIRDPLLQPQPQEAA